MVFECLNYNFHNGSDTKCTDPSTPCAKPISCPDKHHVCFRAWKANGTNIGAGCLDGSMWSEKCGRQCIGKLRGQGDLAFYYSCCTESLCNSNCTQSDPPPARLPIPVTDIYERSGPTSNVLWYVIPLLLIITLLAIFLYRRIRSIRSRQNRRDGEQRNGNLNARELNDLRNDPNLSMLMPFQTNHLNNNQDHGDDDAHRLHHHHHHHQDQTITTTYLTNHLGADDFKQQQQYHNNNNNDIRIDLSCINLTETIDSGRFGTVHKAVLDGNDVAVKIISANDYRSWLNEKQIYNSPNIKHPNILNYVYSDEHLETESYWLILDYAKKGSLYSYLKENTVSWKQLLLISTGVVRGLSHLHEADIAHRDFKSKNILLKHDLLPCITDFGVAAMLDSTAGSQLDHRKKYLQVGTPRYMAPEVLECSVTFTKASFTKIDVYALSLVFWELLSRCTPLPYSSETQYTVSDYKLPFEDLAGSHADINNMLQIVVVDKLRPTLKQEWRNYPLSEMCRAIEDGWEYDYDARISASCFVERIENLPTSVG